MKANVDTTSWNVEKTVHELQRLLEHGVIGFYRSFEITEVLGFQRDQAPTNILTLAVAEPQSATDEIPNLPFLNPNRIVLPGTGWKVGIARYRIQPAALVDAIRYFSRAGQWKPGQGQLRIGSLAAVRPQFVPANSYEEHPWNRILKNNFWEGSHVLELADTSKPHVKFLLEESRQLTALAELVRRHVPIDIDGLSDRLGNVLIQLPVTVISTRTRSSSDGSHSIEVSWHPRSTPRRIRISSEIHEDATVESFDSTETTASHVSMKLHSPEGGARTHIWDDDNCVLLGATPKTTFVLSIGLSVDAIVSGMEPTAREFLLFDAEGGVTPQSVVLARKRTPRMIGSTPQRPLEPWRSNRIFNESLQALQARKEFVQYGRVAGTGREQALADIHWLLEKHGGAGAWLWDPFLDADDVLQTLFFCPHDGADLRALSAGHEPQRFDGDGAAQSAPKASSSWDQRQAIQLERAKGNCQGLKLEFRVRKGDAGWSFHDRFIVFPGNEAQPAMAWSLGTSVNSLGRQHHILQKVANGELIANAFRDLWDKLDAADHLVWKTS